MSSRSPHLPDPEDAKALTREGDEARLGTTWHGFPDKRQLPGTNGCNVGQEDTEISGELPGAVKPSRLGVRGSQVRILSSRPISSIKRLLCYTESAEHRVRGSWARLAPSPPVFLNKNALSLGAWTKSPLILARAWHRFRAPQWILSGEAPLTRTSSLSSNGMSMPSWTEVPAPATWKPGLPTLSATKSESSRDGAE